MTCAISEENDRLKLEVARLKAVIAQLQDDMRLMLADLKKK